MELAKIRNKSRQQQLTEDQSPPESGDRQGGGAVLPDQPASVPAIPSVALLSDRPESISAESGAVQLETVAAAAVPFDPLAVILAGRDRAVEVAATDAFAEFAQEPSETIQETDFNEFLCFRLGDEEYGVNIMEIKEIIKPRELTEVPRILPFIDGVISLRGVIVPIFNMRKRIHLPVDYQQNLERIIIVRSADELFGLRVDRVTDVVRIYDTDREPAPAVLEGTARDLVAGIGRSGGRMVILLDVARVVESPAGEA